MSTNTSGAFQSIATSLAESSSWSSRNIFAGGGELNSEIEKAGGQNGACGSTRKRSSRR